LEQPESLEEAIAAVERAEDARVIAGGTALIPMLRLGLVRPERLIDLHRVAGLDSMRPDGDSLEVGAMATIARIDRASLVRDGWPLLAEAAGRVATPGIRSSATIGGSLAYAEAASDVAPALLCLDAEVRVAGPTGTRALPLSRFLTGFYETALEPGEIVTGIRVRRPPAGAVHGYERFCPRSAEDKPLVGVAALVDVDLHTGRCRDVRLALGGVAPTAMRAGRAESILADAALDGRAIQEAAHAAAEEADPVSDLMGSASYRRQMVHVWVRRLLTRLAESRPR
jgi:carbon-monoxide dehydrogenase medium subunit